MISTAKHPMDIAALTKGQYIPPEDVEQIVGILRTDADAYNLALLKLRDKIEDDSDAAGYPLQLRQKDKGLLVMTDEEAVDYRAKRFADGLRTSGRQMRMATKIDSDQLCAESKVKLTNNLARQGAMLQAMRHARRVADRRIAKAQDTPLLDCKGNAE